MVVHHDQLKCSYIPFEEGELVCPSREVVERGADQHTCQRVERKNRSAERQPKRKIKKTKEEQKKKAKKGRVTTASAMIDLTEKLAGMQNSQMEMMEKAQKHAEDLLVKLEADQRKLNEEGHRRDQEFS
ncbi:Hypothetical predicted protein [Paramuricea clavata]|uniref:Uncharacterized protein n=1 Tax=Paramuricea clavata TaxID=317549 RepID=A0A7D9I966_PARCT|nr:Hypothetical predicted protein [Paramuricea clavata]